MSENYQFYAIWQNRSFKKSRWHFANEQFKLNKP